MNLARFLHRASRMVPDRVAVFSGEAPVATFRSLEARVAGLATALQESLELKRGDRVLLLSRNCPEYLETLLASWWAGLTIVPINARLHAREVAYILSDTGARVCFSSADLLATAEAAAGEAALAVRMVELGSPEFCNMRSSPAAAMAEVESGEGAWLFYTSGTTGRPKGAILTHRNLLAMSWSYLADVDPVRGGTDAILHAAPLSHGSGVYSLPYLAAMASQVIPQSGAFDAAEIWDLIRLHGGVGMFAAPTMLDRLVGFQDEHAVTVERLKVIVVGGAPFYAADAKRAVRALGPRVAQIYGQGESPMTITALPASFYAQTDHPAYEARIASVGYPHSVVEVRVADENDKPCAREAVGEVLVKGDTVMKGYWRNREATDAALRGGWLHTGDVGFLDADGFLTLKGRSRELIISGGSNIYPREVEDVLLLNPAVAEAAVVGRRHPEWGEEVVAFVVARQGQHLEPAMLDAWCLEHIARYKRPKHYRVVDSLPKNPFGKVLKNELTAGLERPDA